MNCINFTVTMNPCRCGYYPDERCTCTAAEVHHYLGKVSQPMLDRIDVSIEAPEIGYEQLAARRENESSESIRARVACAHEVQRMRYAGTAMRFNADLTAENIKEYCSLGLEESRMLEAAFKKLKLSARAYHRIIKVSRTIADLEGSDDIRCSHIGEAICYRAVERKFWI